MSGRDVRRLLERSREHREVRAVKGGTPLLVRQLWERLSSVRLCSWEICGGMKDIML